MAEFNGFFFNDDAIDIVTPVYRSRGKPGDIHQFDVHLRGGHVHIEAFETKDGATKGRKEFLGLLSFSRPA